MKLLNIGSWEAFSAASKAVICAVYIETPPSPQHHCAIVLALRKSQRPLISVHDLGRTELVDRLVQRFDAEVSLKRVEDTPRQHFAGAPVHYGDAIQKSLPHRNIGNVGAPNLIWAINP